MSAEKVVFQRCRWTGKKLLRPDFEWSLKPLLVLMRCFGFPLEFQFSKSSNDHRRGCLWWIVSGFGFLNFFLNAECHFYWIGEKIDSVINDSIVTEGRWTSANFSNFVIGMIYVTAMIVGSHGMMMNMALNNWLHITTVLISMERLYSDQDFIKFRVVSSFGVAAAIMVNYKPARPNIQYPPGPPIGPGGYCILWKCHLFNFFIFARRCFYWFPSCC